MTVTAAEEVLAGTAFLAVVGVGWAALARESVRRWRAERRAARRARQVEAASIEASMENHAFAPQELRAGVDAILRLAAALEPDLVAQELRIRPDAPLISAWRRAHRLNAGARAQAGASVDLLRVVDRGSDTEDRVVVRVRGQIVAARRHWELAGAAWRFDERWTLARSATGWRMLEFDAHPLAEGLLDTPVIAGVWADQERLNEQSLAELAQPPGATPVRVGDVIDRDAPAYGQLLDLSLADGRFLPALIEAALKHLIEAWEQATLVSTDSLEHRTAPGVCEHLLQPLVDDRSMRLVLRDAALRSWEPTAVVADGRGSRRRPCKGCGVAGRVGRPASRQRRADPPGRQCRL